MAHVKIYGRRDIWQDRRGSVSDAVHRAVVGTWGLPPEKRFHRFLPCLTGFRLSSENKKRFSMIKTSASAIWPGKEWRSSETDPIKFASCFRR